MLSPSILTALIVILDLGEIELNELRENYSSAKNFYDRNIFYHLRRAYLVDDIIIKARWLFNLSKIKIRDNNLLEKRAAKDPKN